MGLLHYPSHIGSGLLPFLGGGKFPNVPGTDETDIQTLDGQPVVIINPEEFSIHSFGDTTQVSLTANTVSRVDIGTAGRRAVKITNPSSTVTIYIGFRSNITISGSTGGDALPPLSSISINCKNTLKIYAIASSNAVVTIMEVG